MRPGDRRPGDPGRSADVVRRIALVVALLLAVAACGTSTGTDVARVGRPTPRQVAPTVTVTAEPTQSAEPPAPTTVRVVMAGDVLLHNGLWAVAANDARKAGHPGALDFAPMFAPVRRLVSSADLAVCHLETPVGLPAGPFSNFPLFEVPPQVVDGLRETGFDVCTTASNHSVDQGFDGLRRTLDVLDRAGLGHVGTARSRDEQRATPLLDIKGLRVALLSYTYATNGMPVDGDKPWSVNLIDPARIRADARRAKAAGADAVLVALHWGNEYQHEPSVLQWQTAEQVTRSPHVDLVFGHHAHVVQPVRKVNGTWVAFGLGNFVAQQDPADPATYEGIVARFDIVLRAGEVSVRYAGYRPTYISRYDGADPAMRVIDTDVALARSRTPTWLRQQLAASRARVVAVAGPRPNGP